MFKCPECGQPSKLYDLCNDCVDKFIEELDRGIEQCGYIAWPEIKVNGKEGTI